MDNEKAKYLKTKENKFMKIDEYESTHYRVKKCLLKDNMSIVVRFISKDPFLPDAEIGESGSSIITFPSTMYDEKSARVLNDGLKELLDLIEEFKKS